MLEWKMGGLPQSNLKKKKRRLESTGAVMAAMLAKSVNIIGY